MVNFTRSRVVVLLTVVAAAIAAVVLLSTGSSGSSGARATGRTRISPRGDVRFAERVVARFGGHKPGYLLATNSTRGKALEVLFPGEQTAGPTVQPGASVHVIALHGHFVDYAATPPTSRKLRSGEAPHGTWLVLVIERSTGAVVDLSLTDKRPDLASLGNVTRLTPPR